MPLDSCLDNTSLLKIFRFNPVAMILSELDQTIVQVNAAFRKLSGYGFEQMEGRKLADLPGIASAFRDFHELAFGTSGEAASWWRAEILRADGEARHVRTCVEGLWDESRQVTHLLLMFEDIEDVLRAEQERNRQQDRLRYLNQRLIAAQEEERRRIARELHDEWGQVLSSMKLDLQLLEGESKEVQKRIESKVDRLMVNTRQLSRTLRPSLLDSQGLLPALENLVADFRQHCQVQLHVGGLNERFSENIEITCFRLVQESLTNARRHAEAGEVTIYIYGSETSLNIEIVDDGKGFDPDEAAAEAAGQGSAGLIGMAERVRAYGGEFNIFSRSGMGTRVTARMPIETGGPQ